MILIITHKTDFTVDYVIDKLNKASIPYYRFNCEDVLDRDFMFHFHNEFSYRINGVSKFTSVWFRRTKIPDFENQPIEVKRYLQCELESLFSNLFTILPAKWLSNPINVYRAENKLLQLKVALEIGMKIPNTIVTNSKDEIKEFYSQNSKKAIIKPLHNNRVFLDNEFGLIYTNKLEDHHVDSIDNFLLTPNIIQQFIEKDYEIRITVIDKEVFAASVDSQSQNETKIDWRRKRLKFSPYSLPVDIKSQCIKLTNALGISFGAIDMIKSKDGNYYFLEINPNGQWAWIENDTGLEISNSIIDYLYNA